MVKVAHLDYHCESCYQANNPYCHPYLAFKIYMWIFLHFHNILVHASSLYVYSTNTINIQDELRWYSTTCNSYTCITSFTFYMRVLSYYEYFKKKLQHYITMLMSYPTKDFSLLYISSIS